MNHYIDRAYARNILLAMPFALAIPVLFGLLPGLWDGQLYWQWVLAGALGWLVALLLRAPVAIFGQNREFSPGDLERTIILSSGLVEELVRFVVLALIGRYSVDVAYSVGLGWGTIEVLFAILNGFLTATLLQRTDEQAAQARGQLEQLGVLVSSSPFWGILERFWATAMHIGFTLLLVAQPWLVFANAVVHSATNAGLYALIRRGHPMAFVQILFSFLGCAVFLGGLYAAGVF